MLPAESLLSRNSPLKPALFWQMCIIQMCRDLVPELGLWSPFFSLVHHNLHDAVESSFFFCSPFA